MFSQTIGWAPNSFQPTHCPVQGFTCTFHLCWEAYASNDLVKHWRGSKSIRPFIWSTCRQNMGPKQLLTDLLGTLNLCSSITKRWTYCISCFPHGLTCLRIFREELSSVQDSDLPWEDGTMHPRPRQLFTASIQVYTLTLARFLTCVWVEFPWQELGTGATVCDVGGGVGNMSLQLAKAHPNLRLILQDLPERIQQAKNEVWPKEYPEAIAEGRITFEPIDFFASSPVPGCDIYYVRDIYLSSFLPFSNGKFAAEKYYVGSNSVHHSF